MAAARPRRARVVVAALLVWGLALAGAHAAVERPSGTLDWRATRNRVDARIERWPVRDVLAAIASATGWAVYLDPGVALEVTTRFENLSQADALRRLLGRLNFALLPQAGGPTTLSVFRNAAAQATERVRARTGGGGAGEAGATIPGERIVVLAAGADADALARRLGARIAGRLPEMRAYRLAFDSEERARVASQALAGDPAVISIEANAVIASPTLLEPAAAPGAASPPLSPDASPSRGGVVVGLVDSAVQPDAQFEGFLRPGVSVVGEYQPPSGPPTHGTAMAATILEGAARALREAGDRSGTAALTIQPIDVYGGAETTNTFDLARGITEALARRANVVNLSLTTTGDSAVVRMLIEEGAKRGVLFFGAAGNEGGTAPVYPAAGPGVVSVTAADVAGGVAPWANSGSWIDAIGPGQHVIRFQDQAWHGAGTSVATGWVSGWAAGVMLDGARGARQVERRTLLRWGFEP